MPDVELDIVNDHTDDIINDVETAVPVILEACALAAERYAVMKCAVDTGRLRNSITHATSTNHGKGSYSDSGGKTFSDATAQNTPEENAVYIGTNVEYGAYVEIGTVKTPAQPFLRPAIADHIDEYRDIIKNGFGG